MVRPPLSNAMTTVSFKHRGEFSHLQIAHGSFEDGTLNSSVGSGSSTLSTLTTPHVDVDSATDLSSGMKASPPSVNFGSRAVRFSALDFASISRYCGELRR